MSPFLYRVRLWLATGLCVVLAAAMICMAAAVLVQALAVLVVAVLAAALLLPHPLKWYAKEGAAAVQLFVEELASSLFRKEWGSRQAPAEDAAEKAVFAPASSGESQTDDTKSA